MDAKACCSTSCCCGRFFEFLESSIGKKIMVALAGVLLTGFLLTHLAGNLLMFAGEGPFNKYAEALTSNPLLPVAEAGLVALFLLHIALSVRATMANRAARPEPYRAYKGKGARTPGSRTMALTGLLVLAFVVIHVASFKYKVGGEKGVGLFAHAAGWFAGSKLYAAFYLLAMLGIGLHLSHGAQSAAQTFGLSHPRYTPLIKRAGLGLAAAIALGFASLPLYFGFVKRTDLACCAAPHAAAPAEAPAQGAH